MLAKLAQYELSQNADRLTIHAKGHWTRETAAGLDETLSDDIANLDFRHVDYDLGAIDDLDTAGAYLLARAIRQGREPAHSWAVAVGSDGQKTLMAMAADATLGRPAATTRQWFDTLARVGFAVERFWVEVVETLAFLGKFFVVLFRCLLNPRKLRIKSIVSLVEKVGLDAAPIVMVLSFFIGAVIAYMGANLLATFGASVFMVDLVGLSVLRELAVIITAILLAGRSDSAFTAQIGAMKMRQEIDAMTVMGLDTFEVLVVPRALACLIATPILTFLAMMSGLFGGMLVAWLGASDVSPVLFVARLADVVDIQHFWVGMIKTPFFGLIIAIIGCRQGLAVTGSVESLGSRTTTSVVQAIFAVIMVDAIFAIIFYQLGV
ncbi:MlaE family ABC transporter permease [Litorimonas sp. RW-G-Af-16]